MRIIAGDRRGHSLFLPPGSSTRPTSDLVRESIFNILSQLVDDRPVLDLFAGSGALGLEALSRGAASAILVEKRREVAGIARKNVQALRYEDRATVVAADVYAWTRTFEPQIQEPWLVFLDPPYIEYERSARKVSALIGRLRDVMPPGTVLVLESGGSVVDAVGSAIPGWDERRYGHTHVSIVELGELGEGEPEPPAVAESAD